MPWNSKRDRHIEILYSLYKLFGLNFFNIRELKDRKDEIHKDNYDKIRYSVERNYHHRYLDKYYPDKNFRTKKFIEEQNKLRDEIKEQEANTQLINYRVSMEGIAFLKKEGLLEEDEMSTEVAKFYLDGGKTLEI